MVQVYTTSQACATDSYPIYPKQKQETEKRSLSPDPLQFGKALRPVAVELKSFVYLPAGVPYVVHVQASVNGVSAHAQFFFKFVTVIYR